MRSCCAYLEQVDEEARARVIAYLTSRYSPRYKLVADEALPTAPATWSDEDIVARNEGEVAS